MTTMRRLPGSTWLPSRVGSASGAALNWGAADDADDLEHIPHALDPVQDSAELVQTADLDVGTYDRLFDANVRSAYFVVSAVAPKMGARGRGRDAGWGRHRGLRLLR